MYHGNLAATRLAKRAPRHPALYWNIRHTMTEHAREKFLTRALIRLGGRWSGQARKVVHNAQASVAQHEAKGYSRHNALVIPNGFDLEKFKPDTQAGTALRAELGLGPETVLVGTLGRHHPIKGQDDFLAALAQLRTLGTADGAVHFLCAGRGMAPQNGALMALVEKTGCAERIHLLDERHDTPHFLAGLDVFCLPSRGEGFPNALGEAMACGVPCVATDVGEATIMLEDLGPTVPPKSPPALAGALREMLALTAADRRALGEKCRQRIADRYLLASITERYQDMYDTTVDA